MSDISRTQSHQLDPEVLKSRLNELADEMSAKFGVKCKWEGDTCHLSGSALKKGTLTMTGSEISIELTLGMMGKMIKGQIEKEIENNEKNILI